MKSEEVSTLRLAAIPKDDLESQVIMITQQQQSPKISGKRRQILTITYYY